MKQKLRAIAAAALLATCGYASAVTVAGIDLGTGSFAANPWSGTIQENIVGAPGDVLQGSGEITRVNGQNLTNGTLTYTFTGFTVQSITDTNVSFSGGTIDMMVGGQLFLSLAGHAFNVAGTTFSGSAPAGGLLSPDFAVFGSGLFDVTGGLAAFALDTNSQPDGLGAFADLKITSSAAPDGQFGVAGSVDARGTVSPIPEPETYALMLAGLVAVGFVARRRRNV